MARSKTTTKTEAPEIELPEVTEETYTAKQIADLLHTDPKSFRRFLRSLTSDRAGKGGRWIFNDATVASLREAWDTRSAKGTTPELEDDLETLG